MNSTVISIRISKEIKDLLEKEGINASEVAKKALLEEVKKIQLNKAKDAAKELGKTFEKLTEKEIVEIIRRNRESR